MAKKGRRPGHGQGWSGLVWFTRDELPSGVGLHSYEGRVAYAYASRSYPTTRIPRRAV